MITLLLEIHLDGKINLSDLELRDLLVDTIEGRGFGVVIEETSSYDLLEVVLETSKSENINEDLIGFLMSLGFTKYKIEDITEGEE